MPKSYREKNVRLFVSFSASRETLDSWEGRRRTAPSWPLRWIPEDRLHITLKFLGETSEADEPKIISALSGAAPMASLSLRLAGGGSFPEKGSPSVFWLGVDGDLDALRQLTRSVEKALAPLGFPAEK